MWESSSQVSIRCIFCAKFYEHSSFKCLNIEAFRDREIVLIVILLLDLDWFSALKVLSLLVEITFGCYYRFFEVFWE